MTEERERKALEAANDVLMEFFDEPPENPRAKAVHDKSYRAYHASMLEGQVVLSVEDAKMWLAVANINITQRKACTDVLLETLAARLRAALPEGE